MVSVPLPWSVSWPWVPALDVPFALYVDGLSAQFLLLVTGIGTLVAVYGAGYLAGDAWYWRVLTLLLFMLAMIGTVSSDHLLALFVVWELTGVLSFLLVGSDHASERNRRSAVQALLITGTGDGADLRPTAGRLVLRLLPEAEASIATIVLGLLIYVGWDRLPLLKRGNDET